MLEGFVEQYLLRYLGDYIFGVDKQNLSVTTWRGEIHLRSARLKQEVVELLNLPFQLVFGEVDSCLINVPWNRLGSRPVIIELSGLRVLLGPKPVSAWSNEEELRRVQLARQKILDRADLVFGLKHGDPEPESQGYLGRMLTRIGDNLELHLRDLHVRFQDDEPPSGGHPVAGGIHVDSLEVQTAGPDWEPSFVQRTGNEIFKVLRLRDLSCYHVLPGWASPLRKEELSDEDFRRFFRGTPEKGSWPEAFLHLKQLHRVRHVVPPLSATLRLTQAIEVEPKKPQFDLTCEVKKIQVLLSSSSYQGICGIMSLVSEYFAFQEVTRHWIQRYWLYRPSVAVHNNAVLWWRYSLRCIRAAGVQTSVRPAGARVSFSSLLAEDTLSRLRLQAEYVALVVRSRGGKESLSDEEQARLQRLQVALQLSDLLRSHGAALELLKVQLSEKGEKERSRWNLWASAAPPTKVISVPLPMAAVEAGAAADVALAPNSARSWTPKADAEKELSMAPVSSEEPAQEGEPSHTEAVDFRYRPSVGSWLILRPFRVTPGEEGRPDAEEHGARLADETPRGGWDTMLDSEGDDEPAMSEEEDPDDPQPVIPRLAAKVSTKDSFRYRPSVGTWLHPKPFVIAPVAPERSWFAWLLPSRFTDTGGQAGPAVPENAASSSSSSWLGWSRFSWTRSTARPIEADTTTPAPPASVQPAQAPATSSLSSWLFRSRSPEASPPAVQEPVPEASVEAGPVSSASSVTADSPSRQSSLSSSSGHASQAEPQQPSWRVWFSPGAGTAPQAPVDDAGSVEVLKEKRSSGSIAALAFTEAVALAPAQEAPFLKLELDLPEVVVEMQMDQRSQTIGSAELHVTLSAGEELSVCAEVAAMSLTVRRAEVDARLVHLSSPAGAVQDRKAMSVEYISRDSFGQPWIAIKALGLVLLFQQELIQEVTNFLATPPAAKQSRRGFDRFRRRAKALLYTRGRPRLQLQLQEQVLLLPTRARFGGPLLALRTRFVEAVSREVSDGLCGESDGDMQIVRVDRWTVDARGVQLLYFSAYEAFRSARLPEWTLIQDLSLRLSCLAKKHEEPLAPVLSAFGGAPLPKVTHCVEISGDIPALMLSVDADAYEALLRVIRRLLNSSSSPKDEGAKAPAAPEWPRFQSPDDDEADVFAETPGPSATFRRSRFLSASSDMASPSPFPSKTGGVAAVQVEQDSFGLRGRPAVSFTGSVGTLSVRFHCLPTALDHMELGGPQAVLSFQLFQGSARIGVHVCSLSLLGPLLGGGSRLRLAHAEPTAQASDGRVGLDIVAAWEDKAKAAESENADLRISVDLGSVKFRFSPMHFREFISFAKTTPPSDVVPIPLPGNPLQWRIRVNFEEGHLQWIDEATGAFFAHSGMQQSKILLDLHQDTICFGSNLQNFTIQDQCSSETPMILEPQPQASYVLEINARTFLPKSLEFRGYQTEVSIGFQSIHLQYMGQKFLKCWQWIFGAFLPAVTAGRRRPPQSNTTGGEDDRDSCASFVSIEEDVEMPPPLRQPSLSRQASISPAQPAAANFVELAEGELAKESAWQAAEQVLRQAASDKDARLPALTRLSVIFENPVVSVPLELGGRKSMPAVELRARRLAVSNGPARRAGREALIDALAVSAQQVELWEIPDETRLLAPQDMTIHLDLNLQVQTPPLPMHVLWYAPSVEWRLTSRGLALLRAGFSRNIAGIDPDVFPQVTPDQNQLQHPKSYPVWLVFRLLWRNFRLQFLEDTGSFAELSAKQLVVEVKKHAAPRAVISFGLWEAELASPEGCESLLSERKSCAKAAARSDGRKGGASIHGEYVSDHARGQGFEIDGFRQRVLLLRPLLRRCWVFLFPKQPWFPPPPVMGARPTEELRVVATLQEAHILLVEKPQEKSAPVISVLTGLRYQLQSGSGTQWWLNFHGMDLLRCKTRQSALEELDGSEDPMGCLLLTTERHEVEFRVANATTAPADVEVGGKPPLMETSASRLLVKALRVRVSNDDLRLFVASARAAWGEDEEARPSQFVMSENVLEYRVPDARVELLSEHHSGPRTPFLDVRGSDWVYVRCLRTIAAGTAPDSRVTGKARIRVQLFNPHSSAWEPLLEGKETPSRSASSTAAGATERTWGIKVTRSNAPAPPSTPSTPSASAPAEETVGKARPMREVIVVDCPDLLLLNVTDAFWRVLPRHSMWLSFWRGGEAASQSAEESPLSRNDFAPYAVRNDCGVSVSLRCQTVPALGSPWRLAPGEEQRLDVGKEEKECFEGRPRPVVLAVKLEESAAFDEIGEIAIDRLGRAAHPLVRASAGSMLRRSTRSSSYQGGQAMQNALGPEAPSARTFGRPSKEPAGRLRASSQPRLSRLGADAGYLPLPYLVARVRAKEAYKLLLLESPVRVVNQLSFPVQLRLTAGDVATELPGEIPPLGASMLPASLDVQHRLALRPSSQPGAHWSREFPLEKLAMEADGSFRVHRTAASGEATGCAFCLLWKMEVIPVQVGQAEMSARQWTLELRAPVTVVSALPVPFTVEVTGATDEPLTETLQPQKKREIYSCPAEMLELCVSLYDPQLWSKKVTLRPTEGDATETKVPLAVPTGSSGSMGKSELMVSIVTSWPTASKPVVIFVHSPAWIADHVRSEHLRFIYPRKERSASMISVGRVWDHNSALRCVPLPPCDDAASDATEPRMLPLDCDAKSVGFRLQQTELSQEFKVEALGHTVVRLSADKGAESKDDEPDFMLLGVTTTVQFTERIGDLIYEVRVLHVAPAQVAINATGRPLCLRQARSPRGGNSDAYLSKQVLSVPTGGRAAVHWHKDEKVPLWIRVRYADEAHWRWSGKLPLGDVGEFAFQCCAEKPGQWEIENVHLEVRSDEATTYFIFRHESEATAPILLRNFSSEPILVQQEPSGLVGDSSDEDNAENGQQPPALRRRWLSLTSSRFYSPSPPPRPKEAKAAGSTTRSRATLRLEPQAKRPFAWANPAVEKRRLEIRSPNAESLVMRVEVEKTGKSIPLLIGSSIPLFYDVGGAGHCLVFTVREDVRESAIEVAGDAPSNDFQVNVNVAGLGLSLVAAPYTRAQRLPDFISHLWHNKEGTPAADEEPVRRELLLLTADRIELAYRRNPAAQEMLDLKIHEVQIDNQRDDAPHPVLLCRRREGKEDAEPLIRLSTSRRRWPQDLLYIDFERFELFVRPPLDLKLDEGLILDMLALAQSIQDSVGAAAAEEQPNDVSAEKDGWKLHFQRFTVDKTCVRTSFSSARGHWPGRPPGDVVFWQRLLKSLSSIDRHIFRMDGLQFSRKTLSFASLRAVLAGHYWGEVRKELLLLVFGLELIGAPSAFCGSIALRCKEGLFSPYKGAMDKEMGSADMLEGCIEGTNSCLRNAMFECFNSASKVAGAASQCCRICLDEEPRRPNQAGIVSGCEFCAVSVKRGLWGCYLRPVSGFQSSGCPGLAKGAARGTLGCVAEAFVGCLEATRLVTEGVRNKAKLREEVRRRLPRPLYGMERALRSYDQEDAEIKAELVALDPHLRDAALISFTRDSEGKVTAVVSDFFFLFLDHGQGKVKVTKVPLQNIAEVEVKQKEAARRTTVPTISFRLSQRPKSPHSEVLCLSIRPQGVYRFEGESETLREAAKLLALCLGQRPQAQNGSSLGC